MALTERLAILIDAHGSGAIAEFKKVGAAAQGLQGSVAGGTKSMGGLGQAGVLAGGMLKAGLAAGATAAAGALVSFGVSSVKAFSELGQEVLKFQRASGATAEESSALIAAFDDMGIEAETGSKAIFQLGKRLETSESKLAAFGITAVKSKSGNTDLAATLSAVADAYVHTTDPATRAALVTAAFGKSGQDLIPILEKGSDGIKALYASADATGQILSQEDIAKAEDFRIAMDDLSDAAKQFSLEAGTVLIPVLTDMADLATAAIGAIKGLTDAAGDLGDTKFAGTTLKNLADKFTDLAIPGKLAIGTILDMGRSGDTAASGGLGSLGSAFADLAEQTKPVIDATDEADKELDQLNKALFATVDADRALVDAHRDVTSAQRALNKLLQDGAVDEDKVADARRSLAEATRSAADADRGLAKAQTAYDEALANSNDLHGYDTAQEKLAEAAENLADAKDTSTSAHERATAAAIDLRKAQAGDPEFQNKLADARQKVADATFNMSQKSLASVNAHKEEATALSLHADQVQRLYDLNAGLITQHPDLVAALTPAQTALGGAPPSSGGAPGAAAAPATPSWWSKEFTDWNQAHNPVGGAATTNNVTINATTNEADARLIAKEVMWNLN